MASTSALGERAAARLAQLAQASAEGPGVTRLPYTPQHRAALGLLSGWMQDAGLDVSLDAAGTLIGRLQGPPGAPVLYLGSHQDSIANGGAYDGIMGVVLPLLALEVCAAQDRTFPFSIELLAFADEEGVRFPTALLGSRALAGTADMGVLDMQDASGTTLRSAMETFGLDPDAIPTLARDTSSALGFLEVHIEQGPVLEAAGEALGVVTAINGIERHLVEIEGQTGHAGTVPTDLRRDALVAASELVLAIRDLAILEPDLRATVGALSVAPGVVNAIPGQVTLTAEFRAPDDATRRAAAARLTDILNEVAARNGVAVRSRQTYAQAARPCDPQLQAALTRAIGAVGGSGLALPSGATHDASAMADLCPIAMMFVRCRGGISHRPDEFVEPEDMGLAVEALVHLLTDLAA